MNIMLIGQKWLGAETLKLVLKLGHNITSVAAPSIDDRLFKQAIVSGIKPIVYKTRLTDCHVPNDTDLILCAHAWCYIDKSARGKALHGALGYHPSLLPLHRGKDAIRWSIHMNEKVTGGTVYWMDDRADAGAIAAQDWCHTLPDDDSISLWKRELGPMGLKLFERALNDLTRGNKVSIRQNEQLATWEPSWPVTRLSDKI